MKEIESLELSYRNLRDGGSIFNQYAAAGYKILTKNISPPVRSDAFLIQVIGLIQETFKKNKDWS